MKIQVEILRKTPYLDNSMRFFYDIDESQTIVFTVGDKTQQIKDAKEKLLQLKDSLPTGDKIRILEFHNDEPDETRQPCKILFEG